MKDNKFITLAIESSCDETAASVVAGGREVLSNVISSQIKVHEVFGGVVPEIASRHHLNQINFVIEQAMSEAGIGLNNVDLIGVTQGPGLVGALLIGLATAKGMAYALEKPIVGVHHIKGHIAANYIEHPSLEPPFLALIVSGGHTNLAMVRGYNEIEILGKTRDDAVGEAFDKVARVIGLGYPGGPKIDAIARNGNPESVPFKRVMLEADSLDFSFSGIKTAVLNHLNTERQAGREIVAADIAASFQMSVVDVIVAKAMRAAEKTSANKLVMAGGVAANSMIREKLDEACKARGINLFYPSPVLCTDNAAMIGTAAYYKFKEQGADRLDLDAYPSLPL